MTAIHLVKIHYSRTDRGIHSETSIPSFPMGERGKQYTLEIDGCIKNSNKLK
jgi:hypothetical protein